MKITDEMVDRFMRAYFGDDIRCVSKMNIRESLEAAINPPKEPEISEAVCRLALKDWGIQIYSDKPDLSGIRRAIVAAMGALEPNEYRRSGDK